MLKAPTENQKKVFNRVVERVRNSTKVSISKEMRESGVYSKRTSTKPEKLTRSKGWQTLLETHLSDELLSQTHHDLLKATRLDNMVFPLGVKTEDERLKLPEDKREKVISDEEIVLLLASVNCTVRKIVHGEHARHVYFWSADNKARDGALDMAYKLKGKYAPEKHQSVVAHVDATKLKKIKDILGLTQ